MFGSILQDQQDTIEIMLHKHDVIFPERQKTISYTIHKVTLQSGNCYEICFKHIASSR